MSESWSNCQPHDVMEHESDRVGTDWAYLSDLAEVNPRSPSPTDGETISFVAMADVSEEGVIDNVELRKASTGYTPFAVGDVLIAKITPCFENGKGAHVRGLPTRCGLGSTEFHVLRPRSTTSDRYLYHLTRTSQFRLQGEGLMSGSAGQRRVPTEFFGRYAVRVPPLEEQRRIAEILDTIDETIQATERIITKLTRIRNGLRISQLADLVSSRELRPVSECFDMTLGKMLSPVAKMGSSPSPYLANRNVQWERCSLDNLDEMDFTPSEKRKFSLEPRDVLICEGGEVGRTAIWYGELEDCYFQKAIHRLRTRGPVIPEFMLHYMKYASASDLFKMYTSQTSIAHLTSEQLARLPVPVPSHEEQESVVRTLAAFSRRLEVEATGLQKKYRIRSGVAADLLSGRVRTVAA